MRLISLLITIVLASSVSSCGTVSGAIHGLGDDMMEVIKLSYDIL